MPREEATAASESNTRWRLDEVHAPEPRQPEAMAQALADSSGAAGSATSVRPRAHARRGLAVAAVGLTLIAGVWWAAPGKSQEKPFVVQREANEAAQADGDTVGLGEAAVAASTEDSTRPSDRKVLAEDTLPKPLPRQTRPDSKGHCPYMGQFAINGGCWVETSLEHEGCEQLNGQMFKGRCYVPFMEPERKPTSSPSHPP